MPARSTSKRGMVIGRFALRRRLLQKYIRNDDRCRLEEFRHEKFFANDAYDWPVIVSLVCRERFYSGAAIGFSEKSSYYQHRPCRHLGPGFRSQRWKGCEGVGD